MTKFVVRSDASFYSLEDTAIVGVGFEVANASMGGRYIIVSDRFAERFECRSATEAEVYGLKAGMEALCENMGEESVVVVDVKCDSRGAISRLKDGWNERIQSQADKWVNDILELSEDFYSVNFEEVDRDTVRELDQNARRAQRRLRGKQGIAHTNVLDE